jgi:uncharacterized repeat protein (TIGR03803 family)
MNFPASQSFPHACSARISRGTVAALAITLFMTLSVAPSAHAQTLKQLFPFCALPGCPEGSLPLGSLIDFGGNLYGTTEQGGTNNTGTVYQLTPKGTETVLYSFGSANGGDGNYPQTGVIADSQGNLYGATENGGVNGYGTIFKLTPNGTETLVHVYGPDPLGGAYPYGPLVLDADGNIYGAAYSGGGFGYGTVFRISPDGQQQILHSFNPNAGDGTAPTGGLVVDQHGNLYGTTTAGGTYNDGTVFEMTAKGAYRILYSFGANPNDGNTPSSPVTVGADGDVYGVTLLGGSFNIGTAFKLTPGSPWTETILHTFEGYDNDDGAQPVGQLVIDSEGNLYGATFTGGNTFNNSGTIYELNPKGSETILWIFFNGGFPSAGVLRDAQGDLYGTTEQGGNRVGIVYELTP